MKEKMKILFIYDHQRPEYWQDGLYAALKLLEKEHTVTWMNLATCEDGKAFLEKIEKPDFILGWGAFKSPVDNYIQLNNLFNGVPQGLCLAGNGFPYTGQKYDVIFYETEWAKQWLTSTYKGQVPNLIHAFGYNSQIFHVVQEYDILIDYLTVGAFALWKRQSKLLLKDGVKMAIGEIQKDNLPESMGIIAPLLLSSVIVSDMVEPQKLANFYCVSANVYIPADVNGGGERAVLEAQACGCLVEVEDDNPKLKELLGKHWTEEYYKNQLIAGITSVHENKD